MTRRSRRSLLALALAALATGAFTATASAAPQLKIKSIFRGPSLANAFVELQMVGDGQNQLTGSTLRVWDSDMSSVFSTKFLKDVPVGQHQRMVLLRDSSSS